MPDMSGPDHPALSVIVARSRNGVIGRDGDMPWRLSSDLKRFKALTLGKPIIMGRTTWESLPKKPLPKRQNIIVTRQSDYEAEGAYLVSSPERAIAMAKAMARTAGLDEVFVIGGATLYTAMLAQADRLYLTEIEAEIEGDTFFPDFDETVWRQLEETHLPADDKNSHPTRYRKLVRA